MAPRFLRRDFPDLAPEPIERDRAGRAIFAISILFHIAALAVLAGGLLLSAADPGAPSAFELAQRQEGH
ncbi:MAG TPA: hypothetical protein PKE65_05280 [Rhizobiaceae bacterium]|nr:hypothetical protein [Rhizobiaceae bacterium]